MAIRTQTKRINWGPDELLLAAELVHKNNWRPLDDRNDQVQELSSLLRLAAISSLAIYDPSFRSPSSVALKTRNIATQHPNWTGSPSNGGKADAVALQKFIDDPIGATDEARRIREGVTRSFEIPDLDMAENFYPEESSSADEGVAKLIQHLRRERDATLRAKKIRALLLDSKTLSCQVCGFDFEETYGARGEGYIEIHHVVPLHVSGPTVTQLEDLAALCSNCHRMAHRRPWLSPQELRALVQKK
jgi:5-methylcytosine-specific restriction protein A